MRLTLGSPYTIDSYPVKKEESTMPEDNTTDNPKEHALDYESWEIAFAAYDRHPGAALDLGFNIMVMKAFLLIEPPKLAEVIEGLDKAMEVLFYNSQFHHGL